eukprot:8734797-Pyramimonas_sp.AAC.1
MYINPLDAYYWPLWHGLVCPRCGLLVASADGPCSVPSGSSACGLLTAELARVPQPALRPNTGQ